MRICHFADTHIDASRDGPTDPETGLNGRVLDFLDSLDVLVDYCIENDADVALFAGDAFNKHSPSSAILSEFTKRIYRLSQHCPVVMLVGNHDAPFSDTLRTSSIEVYKSLELNNIIVGNKYEVIRVETDSGLLQVATFPYPHRKIFKSQKDISNMIKELEEHIEEDYPSVFLGHFGIRGARLGSDNGYIMSDIDQLDLSWLSKGPWDYVALGHIHNYQCLNDGEVPPIVYSGSIDRVNFGEEHTDKGFVWVEINEEDMDFSFVSVSPRPMVTLDYEFKSTDRHVTNTIVNDILDKDLKHAIVRIRVKIPDKLSATLRTNRIYEALNGCYFIHSVNISRIEEKRDTRLGDVGEQLVSRTSLELLDVYLTKVQRVVGNEKRQLLKLAGEIMEEK